MLCRSDAISWEDAIVDTSTDASFAQETMIEHDGNGKPHKTQKAYMVLLVNSEILENDSVVVIYGN